MATAISELKAPSGVSRDKLYRELVRDKRRKDKEKVEEKTMWGRVVTVGTGSASAIVSGGLVAKWPRMASFDKDGKIQTRPIIGAVLIAGGLFADDDVADYLCGTGMGLVFPFLSEWGGRVAEKIGS